MDDTQLSRASDTAATRKRRSSILKSQRPPRTPFSELEFNVATPTDSAKSRRVSFSRRTGVAEFVTNEATTTWKNFYEEHNKSLESSGNDSGSKAVAQLGRRAFDQQFEEVEADFLGTLNTGPNISSSLNNFEQQLASLECTDDIKLTAPINNFELSAFTNNHTKLFDDLAIPSGEVTDRIDINFSNLQQIDDLDEIQKDLKQNFGLAFERQNISEYIEVDLNMTQARNEDDMSITDTIHSPKVQDVSKSSSKNIDKDWLVDKENIAINPYAPTREDENFAINEEPDKVLVFDGKRLTIQSENVDKENFRQTLLPNPSEKAPQRKTIVLNVNDDLPNFLDPLSTSCVSVADLKKSVILDDMSITEPLQYHQDKPSEAIEMKHRTVLYDDESGNISITRAACVSEDKRRTIHYEDNGNISVTQAIPTNIIAEKSRTIYDDSNISIIQALPVDVQENIQNEKRKTIIFDDRNISMTQAIPVNILPENTAKRRTIVYEDTSGNLSITQAVSNILISESVAEKRRTIVYEDETGNISVTQAIPSNIIFTESSDRRRTVVFESDTGNISVTQAVPSNLILQEQAIIKQPKINTQVQDNTGRKSIVYENDTGNLSITQVVPNQVIQGISIQNLVANEAKVNKETTKRRTIVFDNDDADISMTQAVPINQVLCAISQQKVNQIEKVNQDKNDVDEITKNDADKRRTIVFENDDADISMTQTVPTNFIKNINPFDACSSKPETKRRTVVFENDEADISMTQVVSTNQLMPGFVQNVHDDLEDALNEALHNKDSSKSRRTIVYDEENTSISIKNVPDTEVIRKENVIESVRKRAIIAFEDNSISLTQALPVDIIEKDADTVSIKSKDLEVKDMDIEISPTNQNEPVILDVTMTDTNEATKQDEKVRQSLSTKRTPASLHAKPIPTDLSAINNENKNSVIKSRNSVVNTSVKSVGNVLVYQAALTKRTEQGDSESQEPIAIENEEKMSSTSKIVDEIKQNEEKLSTSKMDGEVKEAERENDQETIEQIEKQEETEKQNQTEQKQPDIQDDQSEASSLMSKSILDNLLDMSSAEDDKGLMTRDQRETDSENQALKTNTNSNDTLFLITKDEDEVQIQTEKQDCDQITEHSPLPLEYKDQPENVSDLLNKLKGLKDSSEDYSLKNRHYEKIISSDLDKAKKDKIYKANDTGELLAMLSDLTDKSMTKKLDAHLEEHEEPKPILGKGYLALENKSNEPEPRRISFAPRRPSIVMSREDLLNNISMAGAVLKSRIDFDSDLEDTYNNSREERSPKKSVRVSNEVVKTLHFEDSISETTIQSDSKMTPLKKTAFGETSYMQEHSHKVIPDYLKHVSDGIKELMDDLVKPNADVLPFDAAGIERNVKKVPSTCSTQIQANLVTSSQIDINTGLCSNPDSVCDVSINKISSVDMINDAVCRSVSRALKSPIKSTTATHMSDKSVDSKIDVSITNVKTIIPCNPKELSPGRVLIFDHHNPLNNILLAPERFTEAHKYNPCNSTDTVCVSERSNSVQISINDKDYEVERVSTQYNVGNILHSVQQSGDAPSGKITETQSVSSNLSKPMSIDQSTDAKLNDVKDTEVNTLIAMKGNRELLDASSSLTLVDDALARSTFDVDIDSRTTTSREDMSNVRVIYSVDRDDISAKDCDLTLDDELDKKSKKRIYSPGKREKHKHCTITTLDMTPKPTTKMQKLSYSPDGFKAIKTSRSAEKTVKENKSPRKKSKKPGTSITVQQLMTEYNMGPIDDETLDKQIENVLRDPESDTSTMEPTASQSDVQGCKSLDIVSSFTSSKNLREDSSGVTSQSSKASRMDWQPDLIDYLSSKNNISECSSSMNVVAKIDMLPFMGSHECEWESSSGDTWSFRLLHSRLRLTVRLEHRHDNATRTRVRADTPVKTVALEVLPHDTKNTLAALCVSFAAETMRYFISRGCAVAGDVPGLTRRCAAAARLAARWARAMSDARAHLAYSLAPDAHLALKVANIPLRCVWEVSMKLELVVGDAREAPWVRAGSVRVRRVLPPAAAAARAPRALKHLPRDWSHAPRTIWRMFKYLKHKTRDDDDLFMGL